MDVLDDRGFQKEVDTVRALHQTVVSLRAALERSRIEIEELKERIWSSESCELALQTLSVENHILRQKIIDAHDFKENTTQTSIPYITVENHTNENENYNTNENCYTGKDENYTNQNENYINNHPDTVFTDKNTSTHELKQAKDNSCDDISNPALNSNDFFFLQTLKPDSDETKKSPRKHLSPRNASSNTDVKSPRGVTTSPHSEKKPEKTHSTPQSNSNCESPPKWESQSQKSANKNIKHSDFNAPNSSVINQSVLLSTSQERHLTKQESSKTSEHKSPRSQKSKSVFLKSSDNSSKLSPHEKLNYTDASAPTNPVSTDSELTSGLKKPPAKSADKKSPRQHKPKSVSVKTEQASKTSPRAASLNVPVLTAQKLSKSSSNEAGPVKNSVQKSKRNKYEVNSSSSKKQATKSKSSKKQSSPRQTTVTISVTLKSPKKDPKHDEVSPDVSTRLLKNDVKDEDVSQEITESGSTENMDDQSNKEQQNSEEQTQNSQPEGTESPKVEHKDSDTEAEEVDDIELIFTTDETTSVIKEELVSIADGNEGETECDTPVLLNYRTVDFDTPDLHLSCENMDRDLEDDVFHESEATDNVENENTENLNFQNSSVQIHNSRSDNSINKDSVNTENESQRDKSLKSCYSYQDSSFESRSLDKDESFDKFDDKDKYLHKMWSNNSVLVETDISKCGIVDPELPISSTRRNTCPNPVPYRPIMHREAMARHSNRAPSVKFTNSPRPILNEKQSPKTESEAQTDISALPSLWKSESYLAHKVSHQFTTLPSKFPMPMSQKSLRLSEKTKEARRVLLSDINFTSMVPELSRSADHLYQESLEVVPRGNYGQYLNAPGPQLRRYNTGDSLTSPNFIHSQKFTWSPSDYSNFSSTKFENSNMYLNRYRGSLTSINNQNSFDMPDGNMKRRSYSTSHWRQNVPVSFDSSRYVHSGQGPYRSVPNSPTRSRSVPFMSTYGPQHSQQYSSGLRHSHSKYGKQSYGGFRYINGSLPELHGDHDSGDSTDSLVEEAEQYLRSSIDCIVSGRDMTTQVSHASKRRSSVPCPGRDSSPPRNWQPFLPHGIKDLRSDNWVKVIGPEGKIRGGRVRYVGYVLGQQDPFVGIELSTNIGNSDGTFNNRRYFDCSPNHALFIPFKKVVMGWRN